MQLTCTPAKHSRSSSPVRSSSGALQALPPSVNPDQARFLAGWGSIVPCNRFSKMMVWYYGIAALWAGGHPAIGGGYDSKPDSNEASRGDPGEGTKFHVSHPDVCLYTCQHKGHRHFASMSQK